ncbi:MULTISPECIES: polyphosphate--glucose phosphotransferase [unclassified Actinobaculum]|uniref:polyphosphate--glucose phosphotransferase n=1 Tax=unclassified Actinobaculum TaxID=2609299 RepID=UPI000D526138|nr:polyphosphate glucokinase [Actinobaculum sp. 313]RTE48775.1 ROK family protein [Actinobaculum sp. 352]
MAAYPSNIALGIDIGGSGIKGAPVDLETGTFFAPRHRIPTPQPATPEAVAATVAELVQHFDPDGELPIGIDLPAPILDGVIPSMANLDKSWAGVNGDELFANVLGRPVTLVNDADAAGYAEVRYGAAVGRSGLTIVLTLGTGIGSALVVNDVLVPNTELGHVELDGYDAETRASSAVYEREKLSYKQWAKRLQRYLSYLEGLFFPSVFIIGGGISRKSEKFLPLIDTRAPLIPARLLNTAGIVGSALLAAEAVGRAPGTITPLPPLPEKADEGRKADAPRRTKAKKVGSRKKNTSKAGKFTSESNKGNRSKQSSTSKKDKVKKAKKKQKKA